MSCIRPTVYGQRPTDSRSDVPSGMVTTFTQRPSAGQPGRNGATDNLRQARGMLKQASWHVGQQGRGCADYRRISSVLELA
jgi:hypothetical protein